MAAASGVIVDVHDQKRTESIFTAAGKRARVSAEAHSRTGPCHQPQSQEPSGDRSFESSSWTQGYAAMADHGKGIGLRGTLPGGRAGSPSDLRAQGSGGSVIPRHGESNLRSGP